MTKSAVSITSIRSLNQRAVQQLVNSHSQRADEPLVLAVRYNLDDPDGNIHLLEVLDGFPGAADDDLLVTEFAPSAHLLIVGKLYLALGSPEQVHTAADRGDPITTAASNGEVVYFDDKSTKAAELRRELGL